LQGAAARFKASREKILATPDGAPWKKDLDLLAYYTTNHIERHRSVVAAEFAALSGDCAEQYEMPRSQLRLLELRPDLLTPAAFTNTYMRLLNELEAGFSLNSAIKRLCAINPDFPNDSKMLGAMRQASHDSGLMGSVEAAAWVRQLFAKYSALVTPELLSAEVLALRQDRPSDPAWMEDAVRLFEAFPGTGAATSRDDLMDRIGSESALSAAQKLDLQNRLQAATTAESEK